MKSRRIFNKKYCDFIAKTHTKILVAYFIIYDKKMKYKWCITAASLLIISLESLWSPYVIGQTTIFWPWFLLLSFFFLLFFLA